MPEIALFDVHRPALAGHGLNEIGLAAQKSRRLQHVHHRRDFSQRRILVHICEHRDAKLASHLLQNGEALSDARSAEARPGSAIGLVERGLENKRDAHCLGDFAQAARNFHHQFPGLDDAGPGKQEKRPLAADFKISQLHRGLPLAGVAGNRSRRARRR